MERIFAFTGPEGSGKSTQAKILAEHLKIPYVSTGDMIREAASNDLTELGDACRKMFAEHSYLPGKLLLEIVAQRLKKEDATDGVVLDGGFRTIEETRDFAEMLEGMENKFSVKVFYLRTPIWEAVNRMTNGRKRQDDTPDAILSRLQHFYNNLGQRMSLIQSKWEFIMIMAGRRATDDISREVLDNI